MEYKVGDTDMTDEIKECTTEDLMTRYISSDVAQLLEFLPFLDLHFKLTHVTDKDDILNRAGMKL